MNSFTYREGLLTAVTSPNVRLCKVIFYSDLGLWLEILKGVVLFFPMVSHFFFKSLEYAQIVFQRMNACMEDKEIQILMAK